MNLSIELIRLASFFGIFVIMLIWERVTPATQQLKQFNGRWLSNLAISVLNTVVIKLLGPISAIAAAYYAQQHQLGLLDLLNLPSLATIALSVILLDLAIYVQHLVAHKLPWFWRLHRVHHADPGFDVTTALRFHPLEILLSTGIKIAVIVAIGAPVEAVILFEIILNGMAMFNHGNVLIPQPFERILRFVLVTPNMHRIHHSTAPSEHHSNFGFNISLWDRIFSTYTASASKDNIDIGLTYINDTSLNSRVLGLLAIPFKNLKKDN